MIPQYDLASPSYKADPFPTLAKLREAGPVVRVKLPVIGKVWLATHYQSADELLRDHKRFVREAKNAGKNPFVDLQWLAGRLARSISQNMLSKDEPDHRRLRSLVEEAFVRRSIESMRPRLEELADSVLDETVQAASGNDLDFVDFARQFPLAVICELLGLPNKDRPRFTQWAESLGKVRSLAGLFSLVPNMNRLSRFLRQEVRACRAGSREGLIALLAATELNGDRLTEDELVAMTFLLLFAGHETTTHVISNGLLNLIDFPEQRHKLEADWSLSTSAINEVLRYSSPVQMTKPRLASADLDFYGQPIRQGQYLIGFLAAANTDPQRFDRPEEFDIARSPNHHLGFGTGIHICLGATLARLEAGIALRRLLTRYPGLHLSHPRDQIQWNARVGMRAIEKMPLRLGKEASVVV